MFIFSHIETYIKYLPHVEEISEAEFIVTALNTSKRGTARTLGENDTQLLSFSEQAPPAWTIALICRNTKNKTNKKKKQKK